MDLCCVSGQDSVSGPKEQLVSMCKTADDETEVHGDTRIA